MIFVENGLSLKERKSFSNLYTEVFTISTKKYLAVKESRTDRKRYDSETLMKVILFAFMEHGYIDGTKIIANANKFSWV